MLSNVKWLGHATIKFSGDKTIYIDPYKLKNGDPADLILITHDHFDHLSLEDIAKIRQEHTVIVVPRSAKTKLPGSVKKVKVGETVTVDGITIETVPAYNRDKDFHPKSAENVGYILNLNGVRYYHAGDTDNIPTMADLSVDVAFVPVGGTYTMDAAEAARAIKALQPKIAVPIHWGTIVGSEKDAEKFRQQCDCEVRILPQVDR